jgi:hypothetical protein
VLDLGENHIGEEGICAIADALAFTPRLEELSIARSYFGVLDGPWAVARALQHCVPHLTALDMIDCDLLRIPDAALHRLLRALAVPKLTTLRLNLARRSRRSPSIAASCAHAFVRALPGLRHLQR